MLKSVAGSTASVTGPDLLTVWPLNTITGLPCIFRSSSRPSIAPACFRKSSITWISKSARQTRSYFPLPMKVMFVPIVQKRINFRVFSVLRAYVYSETARWLMFSPTRTSLLFLTTIFFPQATTSKPLKRRSWLIRNGLSLQATCLPMAREDQGSPLRTVWKCFAKPNADVLRNICPKF